MKDISAGAICIIIGGFFVINAVMNLNMGTIFRMGSGYFPVFLGGILVVLGAVIALRAAYSTQTPFSEGVPWRALSLIGLAPIVFGLTVRSLGLAPAMFLTVTLSAFASRRMELLLAVILGLGFTLFCSLLFKFGLGLQLSLFEPISLF
jgi:hypothetical protein